MTPHTKLKLANGLMLLGSVLIPVSFHRFLAMASPVPQRMSLVGDGLLQLGAFVVFALLTGMLGFAWSLRVEKRHPTAQVSGTHAFRILVFLVLIAPFVIGSF